MGLLDSAYEASVRKFYGYDHLACEIFDDRGTKNMTLAKAWNSTPRHVPLSMIARDQVLDTVQALFCRLGRCAGDHVKETKHKG